MPNDGVRVDLEALYWQLAASVDPRLKIYLEVFTKYGLSVSDGTNMLIELDNRFREEGLYDSTEGGEVE